MSQDFLVLIIVSVLVISCQREVDGGIASQRGGDSSLLIRRVDEGTEPGRVEKYTSTTDYQYDIEKKLIRVEWNFVNGTRTWKDVTKYIRDSKGRVETIENISKQFDNGVPYVSPERFLDTFVTHYVYQDESSNKLLYSKRVYRVGEKTAKDSIVFEYDTDSNVKKTLEYYLGLAIHLPEDTLPLKSFSTYAHDAAGNLTENALYIIESNGSFTLNIRYRFEYDDKINPLYMKGDVYLYYWGQYAPHNVVKQNVYLPGSSPEVYDNTSSYQYRSDNKPASVAYYSPVVAGTSEATFYYK
jgi:hypothetical protein